MTYTMLYQILLAAEERVADKTLSDQARANSQDTVNQCNERLLTEGITRAQLIELAKS